MLAGLGIILLVGGAILTFAIDRQSDGVDLVAIGWIMMAGGGLSLLVALIQAAGSMSSRDHAVQTELHVSDDGRHSIDDGRHSIDESRTT